MIPIEPAIVTKIVLFNLLNKLKKDKPAAVVKDIEVFSLLPLLTFLFSKATANSSAVSPS